MICNEEGVDCKVVARVDGLRACAGKSTRQGEELFQSLLSEAFDSDQVFK